MKREPRALCSFYRPPPRTDLTLTRTARSFLFSFLSSSFSSFLFFLSSFVFFSAFNRASFSRSNSALSLAPSSELDGCFCYSSFKNPRKAPAKTTRAATRHPTSLQHLAQLQLAAGAGHTHTHTNKISHVNEQKSALALSIDELSGSLLPLLLSISSLRIWPSDRLVVWSMHRKRKGGSKGLYEIY